MPNVLTLSTLSVLAVAGSVSGVYLGRSAISEINPAYYDEPDPRFHADLVANPPSRDAAMVHRAGQLSDEEAGRALGSGCVGCATYPEEYYPVHDSSIDKYRPSYAAMIEEPLPPLEVADGSATEKTEDFAEVERYSSYAVADAAPAEEQPGVILASSATGDVPTE